MAVATMVALRATVETVACSHERGAENSFELARENINSVVLHFMSLVIHEIH